VKRSKPPNDNVAGKAKRMSKSELDEMIEEALVDDKLKCVARDPGQQRWVPEAAFATA
jgi:hypothetical protein